MSDARTFSASQIEAAKCHKAWAFRYIDKLRKPEATWEQVLEYDEHKNDPVLPEGMLVIEGGMRGAACGQRVHLYAEWYLTGAHHEHEDDPAFIGPVRRIDWTSLPGQILESMLPYLPEAGSVAPGDVECRFEVEVDGVKFQGLIDAVVAERGEIWDHKNTRDIRGYAKLPHEVALAIGEPERSLKTDLQSSLYAVWFCRRFGVPSVNGRWTYGESDRVRRALPVIQPLNYGESLVTVMKAAETARTLSTYKSSDEAPANTLVCGEFGGCAYSYAERGGPCTEMRDYGAILVALEQKEATMSEQKKLSFRELTSRVAEANAGAAPAPVPPKAAPAKPAAPAPAPAAAAPAKAKFTPRKPAAPAPAPEPEPTPEPTPEPEAEEQVEETAGVEDLGEEGASQIVGGDLLSLIVALQSELPPGVTLSISKAEGE